MVAAVFIVSPSVDVMMLPSQNRRRVWLPQQVQVSHNVNEHDDT